MIVNSNALFLHPLGHLSKKPYLEQCSGDDMRAIAHIVRNIRHYTRHVPTDDGLTCPRVSIGPFGVCGRRRFV